MLAGIGIAIGLAIVMHVIQQASPIGPEINTSASVALVLLVVGPIIGLGLGLGLAATVRIFVPFLRSLRQRHQPISRRCPRPECRVLTSATPLGKTNR
jgi:hypothetical protein